MEYKFYATLLKQNNYFQRIPVFNEFLSLSGYKINKRFKKKTIEIVLISLVTLRCVL